MQGSCQVLKKLREVKSCLTQHNDRVVGFENGDMSTFLISHMSFRNPFFCLFKKLPGYKQ